MKKYSATIKDGFKIEPDAVIGILDGKAVAQAGFRYLSGTASIINCNFSEEISREDATKIKQAMIDAIREEFDDSVNFGRDAKILKPNFRENEGYDD